MVEISNTKTTRWNMLQNDLKKTIFLCIKILLCDAVVLIGYMMLLSTLKSGYVPVYVPLIILSAAITIIILIRNWMKELHITLRKIRIPICIMMVPSVMTFISYTYFKSGNMENPFLLVCFVLLMFVLLDIWLHHQYKKLPEALKMIEPRLKELHPEIFRTDICRISDSEFLAEISAALDEVPEEKINAQLMDAVIDWYSTYISMTLVLEGIFMMLCLYFFYVY